MIIIRVKGGLGNQLFQYAMAYSLSKRLNQKVVIDISYYPEQKLRSYKLDGLNIIYKETTNNNKLPQLVTVLNNRYINKAIRKCHITHVPVGQRLYYYFETGSRVMPWFFTLNQENIYIDGYYQSEKYFFEYRDEIVKQFTPSYEESEKYKEYYRKIRSTNSVAVHVRRGDYLTVQHDRNPRSYLLDEAYYKNAMKYILNNTESPHFFWFSDDLEWVKEKFGDKDNFTYVRMTSDHADIDEIMLMKSCKNIIAANSTFSWWASWLNCDKNAIHICPEKRYGNESMIPNNWIKIPIE